MNESRFPIREPSKEKGSFGIAAIRNTLEKSPYADPRAVERKCVLCGHTVVIGPGSIELLKNHPDTRIICNVCLPSVGAECAQTSAQRMDGDMIRARIAKDQG